MQNTSTKRHVQECTHTHTHTQKWSSRCGAAETSPTSNHEVAGSIPGLDLTQWVKDPARP